MYCRLPTAEAFELNIICVEPRHANTLNLNTGNFDLNFENVCLNNIAEDVIHDHLSTILSHTIIKTGESNSKVRYDKNRVEQVISNLLTNAVKYSNKADKIIVTIKEDEKNIQIDIQDFKNTMALQNEKSLPELTERLSNKYGSYLLSHIVVQYHRP